MIESGSSKLLRLLENPISEVVPKGWKTTVQLAQETGMSTIMVCKYLREGVKSGKVEKREFHIKTGSMERPVPHYLIKK